MIFYFHLFRSTDLAAGLVAEIKALKDANKALTLYINRIVERVIASEGFEAVLASDFGSSVQAQSGSNSNQAPPLAPKDQLPPLNTSQQNTVPFSQMSPSTATPTTTDAIKEKRASSRLSFSALASSIFSSGPKSPPAEAPKLKPIYLANASGPRGVSNSTLDATEEEEYEEESRERDRINAELVQMGVTEEAGSPGLRQAQRNSIHQALDSSANSLSSSPGRAMTPEEQRQNSSSYFSPFASSAPAPPPQAKTAPVAAIDQISSINERDRQGVAELKNGRASGFSEPRRVSSTRARRERSRSSSQYSANVGEPYPSHASHNAPRASEDLSRSISNASGGDIVGDQGAGWGAKLLRRVSLSTR